MASLTEEPASHSRGARAFGGKAEAVTGRRQRMLTELMAEAGAGESRGLRLFVS